MKSIEGELSRIIYVEMVYIGHFLLQEGTPEEVTMLVLKKISEAKFDSVTSELETINDDFEVLPVSSSERMQTIRNGSTSS